MVMQSAPQLTYCRWSIEQDPPPPPVLERPIVHQAMQIMQIIAFFPPWPLESVPFLFFDSFNFPSLKSYSFSDTRVTLQSFPFHLAQSSCSLTSFNLSKIKCGYELLAEILQGTPLLVELNLEDVDLGQNAYDFDFMRLLVDTSVLNSPGGTGRDQPNRFLPKLQSFSFIPTRHSGPAIVNTFWDYIPSIAGPIQQIRDPDRRPLNNIRIGVHVEPSSNPLDFIGREATLKFQELVAAGVILKLKDTSSEYNLLKISIRYHGIVPRI